jgi:hypothetical protein
MDWKDDTDRQVLKRIAATLVAMAVLADCSCGRSSFVRRLMLWFLQPAEAIAWDFVIREVCGLAIPDRPDRTSDGDGVADALRLAASFRALALVLQGLVMLFEQGARWRACRELSPGFHDLSSGCPARATPNAPRLPTARGPPRLGGTNQVLSLQFCNLVPFRKS